MSVATATYFVRRSLGASAARSESWIAKSGLADRLWPGIQDKLADWFIVIAGVSALYTSYLYRDQFAKF